VYKVKRNEAGDVVRHKARLVAKGYVQCAGIDFDEVFAPVARLESVRMMVALAAHEGWEVHHMDVNSAFLNGVIEEEVYVQQPPGCRACRFHSTSAPRSSSLSDGYEPGTRKSKMTVVIMTME
jgi:hypothetical protein